MTPVEPGDRLSTLVQLRNRTDVSLGSNWTLFAISSYALWALLAIVLFTRTLQPILSFNFVVGLFGTLGFVASAGLSYFVYSLINRHNKHTAREQELFLEALNRARSRTRQDDVRVLLPLSSAEGEFSKLVQKSHERSAVLWALLAFIPYAGWIFLVISLYLLSQDLNAHEHVEQSLLEDIDRMLGASGSSGLPPWTAFQYPRNSLGYAVASLLTLGLFSLFWLHEMVRQPQAHFGNHAIFEPSLLQAFPIPNLGPGV